MKKFLVGLLAVAGVLLPLSQNAEAYRGYYRFHRAGWHHRYWRRGYWYGGYWHPGYWYPGPVVVVYPY
ncbi:MAG TPA: hypothetical protein VGD78_13420 [Chthoniobacterales bacterium]